MSENGPSEESSNGADGSDGSADDGAPAGDEPAGDEHPPTGDETSNEDESAAGDEPSDDSPDDQPDDSPDEPSTAADEQSSEGESPDEQSTGERPSDEPAVGRESEGPPPETPRGEAVPAEPAAGESPGPGGSARASDDGRPVGESDGEAVAGGEAWRSLGYLGYGAVIVGFGGILVAMVLTPWFSVFTGALSLLGFRQVAVAPLFNGSLIVGGALGTGLVAALWATAEQPFHLAAVPFLFLATVSMSLVGVFPLPTGPHLLVAATFFLFLTVGVFLWGVGDYAAGRAGRAATFLLLPVVHVVAWVWWFVLPWSPLGIALPELAGVVALVVWALWVSADLHGLTRATLP